MQLILCAGERLADGATHHDVKALPGIDIVCELHDIHKHVKEGSCERIEFTHALEHFPTKEIIPLLTMIRSLLTPGGELYLEVPNFEWHAQLVKEGRHRDAVYYAFGGQEDEWDFHKTAFTTVLLEEDLTKAGYKDIKTFNQSSIIAYAHNQ
jgi:predicted SAM-dependent methyltransferase